MLKTWRLLNFSLFVTTLLFSFTLAGASFGEIDIIVRESIEAHFREYGYSVDLKTLEYRGEPKFEDGVGQILTVRSVVWAEQKQIAPYWGWHECETHILVKAPGVFVDRGSRCYFEFD